MLCRFRVLVDIIILITSYFTISNCLTNIHFSTRTNTLINNTTSVLNLIYAQYFSFFEENGKHIVTCFLSSNNHFGIRSSSFFSINIFDIFSITYFGYPASVYLLPIFLFHYQSSKLKLVS